MAVPRRYEPQPALGRAIREAREAAGITQRDLAEHADMAEMHLSKIERGFGNPAFGTLRRIAAALHVRPADLVARAAELEDDAPQRGRS